MYVIIYIYIYICKYICKYICLYLYINAIMYINVYILRGRGRKTYLEPYRKLYIVINHTIRTAVVNMLKLSTILAGLVALFFLYSRLWDTSK